MLHRGQKVQVSDTTKAQLQYHCWLHNFLIQKNFPLTKNRVMKEFMFLIRNEIDHQALWPADKHEAFLKA